MKQLCIIILGLLLIGCSQKEGGETALSPEKSPVSSVPEGFLIFGPEFPYPPLFTGLFVRNGSAHLTNFGELLVILPDSQYERLIWSSGVLYEESGTFAYQETIALDEEREVAYVSNELVFSPTETSGDCPVLRTLDYYIEGISLNNPRLNGKYYPEAPSDWTITPDSVRAANTKGCL